MQFEPYQDEETGKWDVRIWSKGNILMSSRQGYNNKADALAMIDSVKKGAAGAIVRMGKPVSIQEEDVKANTGNDDEVKRAAQAGTETTTSRASPVVQADPPVVEHALDAGSAEKDGDIQPLPVNPVIEEANAKAEARRDHLNEASQDPRPAKPKGRGLGGLLGGKGKSKS